METLHGSFYLPERLPNIERLRALSPELGQHLTTLDRLIRDTESLGIIHTDFPEDGHTEPHPDEEPPWDFGPPSDLVTEEGGELPTNEEPVSVEGLVRELFDKEKKKLFETILKNTAAVVVILLANFYIVLWWLDHTVQTATERVTVERIDEFKDYQTANRIQQDVINKITTENQAMRLEIQALKKKSCTVSKPGVCQ